MSEPLSKRNAEVARLRALVRQRSVRREAGRFVVEGVKLVSDVLASNLDVLEVYVDAVWSVPPDLAATIDEAEIGVCRLAAGGIERIVSTTSPQPIVAEVVLPSNDWTALGEAAEVLVAADLNDPGNVGTLARSAVAAGFEALVALGDTADPFGPKAVRASAGAVFSVPVITDGDLAAGLDRLGVAGLRRVGTRMTDAEPCDAADLSGPIALVLGNEAHGLPEAVHPHIDLWVEIPMSGRIESLNVAMAGTILTYEVARQRRIDG